MPSSKTEVIMKSMNMYIWALGTLNQLLIRGTYTQINFSKKNEAVSGKSSFFIGPFLSLYWLLTEQVCMEMLRFHSYTQN